MRTEQAVWLNNQKTTALKSLQSLQDAGLRDAPKSEDSPVAGPDVLFVLAADETAEIKSPVDLGASVEIQSAEWNGYGCRPAIARDLGRRMPKSIPAGIDN